MRTFLYVLVSVLTIVLAGCDSESLESEYADTPVVESYLFVGQPASVKISRLTPYEDDASLSGDDLSKLDVTIDYGTQNISLTHVDSGTYVGPDNFLIAEDTEYALNFSFNGRQVTATTAPLSKPRDYTQSATYIVVEPFSGPPVQGSLPDPVELSWSNPENDYYIVLVENMETDPDPINETDGIVRVGFFRNEPQQTSTARIRPMQFEYYGMHRLILLHITPEYASLYKDTGTTSQNITTPPTNVENGLGIFTAINSDTLYLEVRPE
jgi:hypothetical protein